MSTSSDWSWDRGAEVDALRVGGRVGSYEVLGTLGRGTTSRVFRVRDPAGRELALKVLGSATPSSVKRFELEGKVTASLRHPGIVAVYAAGEVGGHPYLVYELVSGATLAERLPDLGRAARLNVVLQVAQALGYAHAQGVLHRDVKAENVIVDGNGQARVVDFGLALVVGTERMTRTGAWVGSPSYMSPEQIAGHRDRFGPPTDVWGLGVLLYTVLAGRVPFDGQSVVELMAQIAGATPPPLREFDPDCSPELEAVCLRALAKAPAQRYADGAAFAAALEQAIQQPGASTGARWVRRGAVALALTLALGGVLWGAGTGGPPAADSDKPSPRIDEGADVLERARAALAADDALGAIALLEPVVARALSRSAPADAERALLATAHAARATALRRERDLAAAAASLESAEALGPRLPAVQLEAAWQQLAQGEGEAALRAFARLLEREPLLAAAHYGRAACLYELGSLADALTGFERAWELERSRRHALWVGRLRARLGDAQGAIEAFDFALERDLPARALPGESEAEVLIDRARARFLLEDYAACEADCSRSLERSPDAALAHLFRGRARDKLARPSEAEPDLRRAVELDPDNPGFLDELVHHHQLAGDTAKQLELAGDGVARFPTHAHLRFDRATAHYTRGDVGLALADFDNLVERGENLPLGVQFRVRERRAELRAISGTHDAGEDLAVLMRLGRDRAARTQAHLVAARVSSILGAPRHALAVLAPLEDGGASDPLRLERIRARLVGGEFLAAQEELLPFRAQTSHPDAGGYAALQLAALGELEALEGLAPERWTGRLAAFLRGEGTVAALLRDARAEDQPWSTGYTPRERACEAHYYVALQLDARGALDAARAHYRACVGCGVVAFNEFQLALGRLRFLARR